MRKPSQPAPLSRHDGSSGVINSVVVAAVSSVMAACTVCVAGVCTLPRPDSQGQAPISSVKAFGDRTLMKAQ